jgi:hypothetical protein
MNMGDNIHEALRAIAAGVSEGLLREYVRLSARDSCIELNRSDDEPSHEDLVNEARRDFAHWNAQDRPGVHEESGHTFPADLAAASEQLTRGIAQGYFDPLDETEASPKWM